MISTIRNSRGQGLVQVLVAAAIGAIIMTAIATSQSNQARENRAMSEKLAANDFQNQMLRSLLDGSVCSSLLNGKTFDSTNAVAGNPNQPSIPIPLPSIPVSTDPGSPVLAAAGDRVSAISNSLRIDDSSTVPFRVVGLVGSVNGTTGTFTGSFQISFNQGQLIRSIKAASTRVILKTSAAGTTQTVTGCTTIMDNTCWVSGPSGLSTVACGNVGIGTSSPSRRLTVSEPGGTAVARIESAGGASAADLELARIGTGVTWTLSQYTDDSFRVIKNSGLPGGSTPITIDTGGEVGIGTGSPHSPLHVNGYLQILTNSVSPPVSADCSIPDHIGRMIIYTPAVNIHRICFCPQATGGATIRWWCTPAAVLPP